MLAPHAAAACYKHHALLNEGFLGAVACPTLLLLPLPPPLQIEELELQYKTCYARILDSKRRFLEAALRYVFVSQ